MAKHIETKNKEIVNKYYTDAVRFYKNAKSRVKEAKIEYDRYIDLKPVVEACSSCYLSVLKALNGYFLERGIKKEDLPKSYMGYWTMLNKYLAHNGKIKAAFQTAYEILHISGYYREVGNVKVIKEGFSCAKFIIEHLSKKKIL